MVKCSLLYVIHNRSYSHLKNVPEREHRRFWVKDTSLCLEMVFICRVVLVFMLRWPIFFNSLKYRKEYLHNVIIHFAIAVCYALYALNITVARYVKYIY